MQKTLGILLALCFLLSVTAGAASANGYHGKEKYGHHAEFSKWNNGHHAKFGEWKRVAICCFDGNCNYNCNCNDEDNCNCDCNCNDDEDD